MNKRTALAAHLKQYAKMARYCGDTLLAADCKALFFELRDAKAATSEHERRAAELADRARQLLSAQNIAAAIGGRPVWWDS